MDINDARISAKNLLEKIIEHQPNLITSAQFHTNTDGAAVAKFCSDFIENYASYLATRPQK